MPAPDVKPKEAKALVDQGWTYLDVRTVPEFEGGHPEGAHNVPVMEPSATGQMRQNASFAPSVQAKFPKDTKFVVGCMAGGRSRSACQLLEAAGYQNLRNVAGGFGGAPGTPGWRDEKLPVSQKALPGRSYRELKK